MGEKIDLAGFFNDNQIRIKDIKDYLNIINSNSDILYNVSLRYKNDRKEIIKELIKDIKDLSNPYVKSFLLDKWNKILENLIATDIYKSI